jgi:hypothetical protein
VLKSIAENTPVFEPINNRLPITVGEPNICAPGCPVIVGNAGAHRHASIRLAALPVVIASEDVVEEWELSNRYRLQSALV